MRRGRHLFEKEEDTDLARRVWHRTNDLGIWKHPTF